MREGRWRAIGLMSGTSLDGVDAAWIETDGERVFATGPALTVRYDDLLRSDLRRLLDLAPGLDGPTPFVIDVAARLTQTHIEAVRAIRRDCDIIGFHGQTIFHAAAARRTWQIGDARALAAACGVTVAWDFRTADVMAGGEGAPLVPVYHAALAASLPRPLAVLNLGGVGNVTWIGADGTLLAFDTGPGNGPLDDWVSARTNLAFDRDGEVSASGAIDVTVLSRLLAHPYFARLPPKSLDRLDFGQALEVSGIAGLGVADGAATLAAFTAAAVALARLPASPVRWLVTGGGRLNPTIMRELAIRLGAPVVPVEAVGWNGDALEAQCFGLLAVRVARGLPLSFPGTTGVPRPMPGGRLAPPPA